MELFVSTLLATHVLAGAIALIAALLAASNRKGSKNHRKIGTVYFWSMFAVAVTAIPVTFVRPNPFLFAIALFSFYMAFAGYRRGKAKYRPEALDVFAAWSMLAVAVGMIGYGIFMALNITPVGWALVAFGSIAINFSIEDIRDTKVELPHHIKVTRHLGHMLGGTIATVTAVLVQQVTPMVPNSLAQMALWLAPTAILLPLIAVWSAKIAKTKRYRLLPAR
jgi:uncharacterized membrane protein